MTSLLPHPVGEPASSFRSDSSNLDLIRAVAVLSVFFAHLNDIITRRYSSLGWHFAQMGVLIFFVHTSMVLMLSLERTKLRGRALFGSFYLRRAFRLYPLSMCCVTFAMILSRAPQLDATVRHWRWTEYISNMALTVNLTYTDIMVGGLWTLPLEMQMYLTLPLLFLIGRARPTLVLVILWVISIPVAILQPHVSGRLSVLGYTPCFLAGVIAWKLSLSAPRRFPGWLWPAGFLATWPFFLVAEHDNSMSYRWAFCLALGLSIPHFREIRFGPLRAAAHLIAKYSYGIYLSHVAVIMWSFGLPVPAAAKWAVFLLTATVVPVMMYHGIERPMILVGQRVTEAIWNRSS
ncbi:MAG: acyltransferase [Acidobacteria bacterium]|nr:acyltransferase [Acidobacteriota bacterium]